VGVAAYMAACFFSVLVVVAALTTRWPRRALPVVVVLVGLMADYVAVKSWEPWRAVSPGLRLLEGVHRPTASDPLSLGMSGALYGGLVVASVVFGLWSLKRRDL
jgi:hypothetical protein